MEIFRLFPFTWIRSKHRWLLAGLALAVSLAVAEWAFRRTQSKELMPWRHPEPYVMFSKELKSLAGDTYPHEFKVFMLGGSTVAMGGWVRPSTRDVGGNSGEGRPLPELVESELQQRGFHNVHVINGGVPSHVSGQELATIVYRVVDLKPDLIVMYDGGNDILSPYDDDPRPGYPFNFMVSERNPLLQNGARYPLFSLMAFKSELLRTLLHPYFVEKFTRRSDFRKQSGYETESWREEIAKNYVRNLVKAQTISRAFGAEFIAFFQPLAFFARPDCETPLGRHALKVREHISREMRRAREIHSLNVVDLSELFKNETDEIFGDPIHIKDASNKAVARTIAAHLSPLIKKIRR